MLLGHWESTSPLRGGGFIPVSSGGKHTCGLREGDVAICRGDNDYGQFSPPEDERFISVSSGGGYYVQGGGYREGGKHTCGLRADGVAICWGSDILDQSSPPDYERFISISNGEHHTCGLRSDGVAVCWGDDGDGQSSPPEDERPMSISSGGDHTCGLREDGVIVCWGRNRNGQSSPPLR